MRFTSLSLLLLTGTSLSPAFAQEPATPPPAPAPAAPAAPETETPEAEPEIDDLRPGDIVVRGQRLRGAVIGDVEPEEQLNEEQVRALGASSIGEMLDRLAPQTRSNRGRGGGGGGPIVLLNGRRIAGFQEIQNLPPEAVERVDILPEQVALSYGYRADQRVVNIVLKENFNAITLASSAGGPISGGRFGYDGNANLLRISRDRRLSIEAQYSTNSALLESERDLIQSAPPLPYDLAGNVGASPFAPGAEIDPALSAAAGTTVTVAGVPASAAAGAPTLGAFVPGANRAHFTDVGRYRTLLPATENVLVQATMARNVADMAATANVRFASNSSESRLGLPSLALNLPETNPYSPFSRDVTLFRYSDAAGPLMREAETRTLHGGLTLSGDLLPWRWNFTANYDHVRTITETQTGADPSALQARIAADDPALNPFAPIGADLLVLRPEDRARSISQSADARVVLNGPLVRLPAGPSTASVTLSGDTRSLSSETLRGGVAQSTDLSRNRAAILGSFDLPLTSSNEGFLGAVGNISLNFSVELEHFSDFGTLTTLGYGLRWEPFAPLSINFNVTEEDGAPSMQQLGDPVIATPNARTFDFVRGETVDITRIDGGNPALLADSRRVISLGFNLRLLGQPGPPRPGAPPRPSLSLNANFLTSRIDNPIAAFPVATAEIEAAFPGRFVRDASGRLLAVDGRPVNFARSERQEVRWGLNFQRPFPPPPAPAGAPGAAPDGMPGAGGRRPGGGPPGAGPRGPGGGPRGGGGQRGPGGGGPGGGRGGGVGFFGGGQGGGGINFGIYHTWRFTEEVLIRPGVPVLDYLDGSAFNGRGGRPRHEIEANGGVFRGGLGAFMNLNWQSGTTVRGGAGAGQGDLSFSSFSSVNLTAFADLGQQQRLVRAVPLLRGARVFANVNNLFDTRLRVTDNTGATPISYQDDYLDPIGRSFRVGIRKLF